jgi:hypothetical protein
LVILGCPIHLIGVLVSDPLSVIIFGASGEDDVVVDVVGHIVGGDGYVAVGHGHVTIIIYNVAAVAHILDDGVSCG